MTADSALACKTREKKTKGYLREMMKEELIPGIVYGQEKEPTMIFLNRRELYKKMGSHGTRGIFHLEIDGKNPPLMALVREVQKKPVTGHIIHIDFLTVSRSEKVSSKVGISIVGEEELIKKGQVLQAGIKEVEVFCLPQDIPELFSVDVSEMEIGDRMVVGDLVLPPEVELNEDAETLICSVLHPAKSEVESETEEAEAEADAEAVQ
ncbi:MAG: 50S ribosomal protein L25 [Syntrophomonadaceae bacterium]|nr:50S ribosomal protein L25 [Syntrophomonadaceae bacterium]